MVFRLDVSWAFYRIACGVYNDMKEPYELRPGATYVIECDQYLSEKIKDRLLNKLHWQTHPLGCRFIILDGGLKIANGKSKEESARELDEYKHTARDNIVDSIERFFADN